MATAPQSIERFEREAVFIASPERIGRALRERAPAGSWPSSPIGGGSASPHVTAFHLANFILAQAGFVPSEAANALETLSKLPCLDTVEHSTGHEPDLPEISATGTLSEILALMINLAVVDPAWRESLAVWMLTMSPDDPVYAVITLQHVDRPAYNLRFSTGSFTWMLKERDRAQRTIEIPRKALMICAELWADSKAKLATRDENADPLAGGPASSTAPTAQARQDTPNSPDATARVCAPATSPGGPSHARRRRHSPTSVAAGVA